MTALRFWMKYSCATLTILSRITYKVLTLFSQHSYSVRVISVMASKICSDNSNCGSLQFEVLKKWSITKARTSLMRLPHYEVELPMFMPVGTQVSTKNSVK